jgi:YbgC/YbaW family acyl-CoA thioester hydrolase
MSFITTRTILFGDCDPAGIVYTPRITYFIIEAVHDFLTKTLGAPAIREIFAMGILPPARALSIEYLAPMSWDETINIVVSCKELTTTSFTFLVEARNSSNEVAFISTLTQVSISPETKRPTPIPQVLREALCSA